MRRSFRTRSCSFPSFRRVSSASARGPSVSRWPARSAISALTSRSSSRTVKSCPPFDADIAGYVRKILESRRVTFHLGATVTGFSGTRSAVTTHFTHHGEPRALTADQACLRTPVETRHARRGRRVSQAGVRRRPGAAARCPDGELYRRRAHPDGGDGDRQRYQALAGQLSVHPRQTERFIKIAAHDHRGPRGITAAAISNTAGRHVPARPLDLGPICNLLVTLLAWLTHTSREAWQ